ncbi:MAG TPA: phenylacetic acid degradation b [Gemmatimonadota bacterium]|nr:phenylacetic acid degradation b [Gemmatimonadota bacterium]
MAGPEQVFEVFARIAPGDPMSHIGTLNAPGIELARVYAWRIYDEEDWSDMWVAPRDTILSAHPDQDGPLPVPGRVETEPA